MDEAVNWEGRAENMRNALRIVRTERENALEELEACLKTCREQCDTIMDLEASRGTRAANQLVRLGRQVDRVEALAREWEEPHLGDFLPAEAAQRLRAALAPEET